jgi:Zn-finger protein
LSPKHSHKYFKNTACEYFPCHEVEDAGHFNCLFCFCPLYFIEECGGDFRRTAQGLKDCTPCAKPHLPGGYEHVIRVLKANLDKARAK